MGSSERWNDLPLVSVVTISFNQGCFIEDTLKSVKSQTYPRIEHIVMDGGSKDNTLEILRRYEGAYGLRWYSEPDKGPAHAYNKGFALAQGEIIGWLNSDDVYISCDTVQEAVSLIYVPSPGRRDLWRYGLYQ